MRGSRGREPDRRALDVVLVAGAPIIAAGMGFGIAGVRRGN